MLQPAVSTGLISNRIDLNNNADKSNKVEKSLLGIRLFDYLNVVF